GLQAFDRNRRLAPQAGPGLEHATSSDIEREFASLYLGRGRRGVVTRKSRISRDGGRYCCWKSMGQNRPAEKPPSTNRTCPVMNADASEARKMAEPTRSAGWPMRLSGVLARPQSRMAGWDHSFCVRSVRMKPGAMALTRTPRSPHSMARARVI